MSNGRLSSILLVLILSTSLLYAESKKYKLHSDQLSYSEDHKIMIASSNVLLSVDDIKLSTPKLFVNVEAQQAWGSGNIVLTRGSDSAFASGIQMHLKTSTFTLEDVRTQMKIPDSKDAMFVHAKTLTDMPNHQSGTYSEMTSCDLLHPHYKIKARQFDYFPGERITGSDVVLDYPIFFLPFQVWAPFYTYELGKRHIIWNFPTIGQKNTPGWGWFMQNTIDYDHLNGKDSSVLLDFFQFKGVGVGIDHQYDIGNANYGNVYAYYLHEKDTGLQNYRLGFQQSYRLNNVWSVSGAYNLIDAERINSRGRDHREDRSVTLAYNDLGDVMNLKLSDSQNFNQFTRDFTMLLDRSFNQEKQYSISYALNDNFILRNQTVSSRAEHILRLPDDNTLTTRLAYDSRDSKLDTVPADTRLQATTEFFHQFDTRLSAKVVIDHLFDLDGRRVTTDSFSNANSFFFKQPEITLTYSDPSLHGFSTNSTLIMARYQEVQYDRSLNEQITFPASSEFGLEPNTYIFRQTLERSFVGLPGKGTLRLNVGYEQMIFKSPGLGIFEGDALYKLSFAPSYTASFWDFLKTTTTYQRRFIPPESNSPFITAFKDDRLNTNFLDQAFTLYYLDSNRFSWENRIGYDFERKQWNPYNTTLLIKPSSFVGLTIGSGVDINRLNEYLSHHTVAFENANILQPLTWTLDITPSANTRFSMNHSQDLNQGYIRQSNLLFNQVLGSNKDYEWSFETLFTYDTRGRVQQFDPSKYAIQTFSLVKNEHCRKIKISYNKQIQEIQLLFTINAFPNDSFGFTKTRNNIKLQGALANDAQERF